MTIDYYPSYERRVQWYDLAGDYARALLSEFGIGDKWDFRHRIEALQVNPIIYELQNNPLGFIQATERAGGGKTNIIGTCRAAVLCQMFWYDLIDGPERDNKPKALRRHWYAYFKQFSQMFAFALGKVTTRADGSKEMNDLDWAGRLSTVYSAMVDSREVTYRQLWVSDASRMMKIFGEDNSLYKGLQLVIAVEKDSLFGDFENVAKALGAVGIISGKGKNSKAAMEKFLRELGWAEDEYGNERIKYDPMQVLVLSDYDYDGEGVIQGTFAEQMRRYCDRVQEERIGVMPWQVRDVVGENKVWDSSYQIKMQKKHSGNREWADHKGLYWATCVSCGHEQYVVGCEPTGLHLGECHDCGDKDTLMVSPEDYKSPHGFEVESLNSRDYYEQMVEALFRLIDWDDTIYELRDQTEPDEYSIIQKLSSKVAYENELFVKVTQAERILAEARYTLEEQIRQVVTDSARQWIEETREEWLELGEDPDFSQLVDHVVRSASSGWVERWQPFDVTERTNHVLEVMELDDALMERAREQQIADYPQVVERVRETLQ